MVRNRKAYKLSDPEVPYQFHHSVGNECFIGFWGYPFVFDGCFINWSEWNELPNLDLDVIFVVIEKRIDECKIEYLRKKYPNSIIIGYLKETWNWNIEWESRIKIFNELYFLSKCAFMFMSEPSSVKICGLWFRTCCIHQSYSLGLCPAQQYV